MPALSAGAPQTSSGACGDTGVKGQVVTHVYIHRVYDKKTPKGIKFEYCSVEPFVPVHCENGRLVKVNGANRKHSGS